MHCINDVYMIRALLLYISMDRQLIIISDNFIEPSVYRDPKTKDLQKSPFTWTVHKLYVYELLTAKLILSRIWKTFTGRVQKQIISTKIKRSLTKNCSNNKVPRPSVPCHCKRKTWVDLFVLASWSYILHIQTI